MIFATADCIPLTIVWKVFAVVDIVLVVDEANSELKFPITALVIVALVIFALLAIKLLVVAFVAFKLFVFVLLAFSKLVFIVFAVVVPSNERLVSPFIVAVEVIPSTILVIRFVVDEKLSELVVVAAMSDARLEVEITPLTLVVMIPVLVEKVIELLEITDDVALTPLIVVVNTLPVSVVVNEFIILATLDVMPFIIVVKKLPVDVATLELIMLADDALPAITEVIVLIAEVRLFVGLGMMIEVVDITPFMLEVSVCVVVA